jgi:molybdate transport system ATP-binding protein
MTPALGAPLVTLDDVDVRLWGRDLLRGISFSLREGESWAVFGGNGAGKSTLLRLLRGEAWPHPASRGRRLFHLDGPPTESPIGARERIALVSAEAQDAYLRRDWAVPVEDVVRSGFTDGVWPGGPLPADGERRVDAALGSLGLGGLRRRTMVEVSTGEARRALLARALAPGPRALLLDEFVNGLDAGSRAWMLDAVSTLARRGTPTVLATHRPEEVIHEASHAAILEGGRIVRSGPRDEVEAAWRSLPARSAVPTLPAPAIPAPARRSSGASRRAALFEVRGDVLVDGRRVLRGLDWTLLRGESWAVRGPNGAGKSTFLRLLLGEEHLAPGGRIKRLDLGPSADVREVRARVGLVAPELQARHRGDATGLEVALSGFSGSIGLGEEPTALQRAAAEGWLAAFGAAHLASRSILALSYGEMRRLLFARALVTDPEVLLLDEPFNGLEPRVRAEAMDLVDRLCRAGRTTVLVTHHDDEVVPSIRNELRLRDGHVESALPIPVGTR